MSENKEAEEKFEKAVHEFIEATQGSRDGIVTDWVLVVSELRPERGSTTYWVLVPEEQAFHRTLGLSNYLELRNGARMNNVYREE